MSIILLSSKKSWPKPIQRTPLITPDTRGPYQVHTVLPFTPPKLPTLEFNRGDFSGMSIPSLPSVTAGPADNSLLLDWFLDAYINQKPSCFDDIINTKYRYGYSHYLLSRGGWNFSLSPKDYAFLSVKVKETGLFVNHMLTAKSDGLGHDTNYFINLVQPYLDMLLVRGAIDKACLGWELNLFWNPTELQKFKQWLKAYLPSKIIIAAHFSTYVTAWQLPGHDRASFYNDGIVKELWYQTDPYANLGTMQAHLNDAMVPASGLQANNVRLCWFEVGATQRFYGTMNEEQSNMYGYYGLCTPGPIVCDGGFMNGGKLPSGLYL